jgi:putative MATE family efflux protein
VLQPAVDPLSVRREIVALAWPLVLQALLRTVMFLADTYMLGRYDESALAAIALAGPLAHTLTMILGALGVGTLATVARATGAGDRALQEQESATSLVVGVVTGGLALVAALATLPLLSRFFSVPDHPQSAIDGAAFLQWIICAIPSVAVSSCAGAVLRGAGDTRTPLVAGVVANVVNVFGNWVLIFGHLGAPRMGVAGAGLSTAVALSVEALLLVGYLFSKRLGALSFARVTRGSIARLVRVSAPAALEPVLLQTGFLLFISMMRHLGNHQMAAHRVAVAVESISFMPGWGLSIACGTIVGQYLGAKNPAGSAEGLRQSGILALKIMVVLGVVFAVLAVPMARIFADDPRVVGPAANCLRIAAIEQVFMALAMVLGGALRGAGDTKSPVAVGLIGVWCIRLPLSYVFAYTLGLGIFGAWIVMVVDWGVRALAFWAFWRRGRWKTIQL